MIQNLKDAVAGGAGGGEHLIELVKLANGLVNEGAISEKADEITEGKVAAVLLAFNEETAAYAHDRDSAEGAEEVGAGAVERPAIHGFEGVVAEEVGGIAEAAALSFTEGKGADEAMPGDVFHEEAVEGSGGFTGFFPEDASGVEMPATED